MRSLAPLLAAVGAGFIGCARQAPAPATASTPATFVGHAACARCHAEQTRSWEGSHHALAMQAASATTVRGRFEGRTLRHFGVRSTFSRRDGRFVVRTDGADGTPRDFEVGYTLGVHPLQQYLVAFPGGRYQALALAWDTRSAKSGGQRWFHLYPGEAVPAGDALHWTGPQFNWNHMCAECHSTGLRKGYRAAEDRFETTWTETGVACEACHGPGARHVAWAEAAATGAPAAGDMGLVTRLRDPGRRSWIPDSDGAGAQRLAPPVATDEIETCALCHARRSAIAEPYVHGRPLLDSHRPALLDEGLYSADGQIEGEVYEYGSFLQSRMYRRGVTCADCHEPHGLGLRAEGNALCARCHASTRFDAPSHHRHRGGARCVDCHMPQRTYMLVDPRRDHSLRVPRPDLTLKIGAPNACNACHADRTAGWAAEAAARWYGPARPAAPHYGVALYAGRAGAPGAGEALVALAADAETPGIVRATALSLLARYPDAARRVSPAASADPDPLVRLAAVSALEALPPDERAAPASPRLRDNIRAVRSEAARVLASLLAGSTAAAPQADFDAALDEYRAAQLINSDRPEARMNLGWLHVQRGELKEAEAEYAAARRLDPSFTPAAVNLADVYRTQERDADGERVLREALAEAPRDSHVHHALGLLLLRRSRLPEALEHLGQAAASDPANARHAYVYGLALRSAGRTTEAAGVLARALRRHPADRDLLLALADLERGRGR